MVRIGPENGIDNAGMIALPHGKEYIDGPQRKDIELQIKFKSLMKILFFFWGISLSNLLSYSKMVASCRGVNRLKCDEVMRRM